MRILFVILIIALVCWAVVEVINRVFSQNARDERALRKADRQALTAMRLRSNLAERALREIAAGAELPVFIAEDALREIEKTYSKEIA